jgi:hypothetical protein
VADLKAGASIPSMSSAPSDLIELTRRDSREQEACPTGLTNIKNRLKEGFSFVTKSGPGNKEHRVIQTPGEMVLVLDMVLASGRRRPRCLMEEAI